MSKYLSRSTLDKLFKLHVRPPLDYGDVIYHIPQNDNACLGNYLMEKLESVQYSAALAVQEHGEELLRKDSMKNSVGNRLVLEDGIGVLFFSTNLL